MSDTTLTVWGRAGQCWHALTDCTPQTADATIADCRAVAAQYGLPHDEYVALPGGASARPHKATGRGKRSSYASHDSTQHC